MRLFQWLFATEIPHAWDLRRCGWRLTEAAAEPGDSVALAHLAGMDPHAWTRLHHHYPQPRHNRVLLLGVDDSAARARLLECGFGDVLSDTPALSEVAARAERVAERARMLPKLRTIGPLRLDLFARDGFVAGRPLALHPREFALLWRLADTPGTAVTKVALLTEVWRLCHVPGTNSLAVHVFRLRAKLAGAGLDGLVRTAASGGYMLTPPAESDVPAIPMLTGDSRLTDLIAPEAVAARNLAP